MPCYTPPAPELRLALDTYWRSPASKLQANRPFNCHCDSNTSTSRFHTAPYCSRSAAGEEVYVAGLLRSLGLTGSGVFVEAGGNDGCVYLTTALRSRGHHRIHAHIVYACMLARVCAAQLEHVQHRLP